MIILTVQIVDDSGNMHSTKIYTHESTHAWGIMEFFEFVGNKCARDIDPGYFSADPVRTK